MATTVKMKTLKKVTIKCGFNQAMKFIYVKKQKCNERLYNICLK